jgi:hypothetical protein
MPCKPIAKGETLIEYTGEIIDWPEALRRHPHDPDDPHHTFYFHIDDGSHVIDAKLWRQCLALDQPRLRAQLRGRRGVKTAASSSRRAARHPAR